MPVDAQGQQARIQRCEKGRVNVQLQGHGQRVRVVLPELDSVFFGAN